MVPGAVVRMTSPPGLSGGDAEGQDGGEFEGFGFVELRVAPSVSLSAWSTATSVSACRRDAADEVVVCRARRCRATRVSRWEARTKAARPMSSPQVAQAPRRARSVVAYSQVARRTASSTRSGTSWSRGWPS